MIQNNEKLKERVAVRLCLSKSMDTAVSKDCNATEAALFWIGTQVALGSGKAPELAEELGAPTQFGRPNWNKELGDHGKELLKKFPREETDTEPMDVGVYVCGNPMLVESLEHACDDLDTDEIEFTLYAEQF